MLSAIVPEDKSFDLPQCKAQPRVAAVLDFLAEFRRFADHGLPAARVVVGETEGEVGDVDVGDEVCEESEVDGEGEMSTTLDISRWKRAFPTPSRSVPWAARKPSG